MGWTLTGTVQFRFNETLADISAYGSNVAWCCPCGSPVLFVYEGGKPGSSSDKPAWCHGCDVQYFLDPQYGARPEPPPGMPIAPSTVMRIVKK
jgi:hypothetical protein